MCRMGMFTWTSANKKWQRQISGQLFQFPLLLRLFSLYIVDIQLFFLKVDHKSLAILLLVSC